MLCNIQNKIMFLRATHNFNYSIMYTMSEHSLWNQNQIEFYQFIRIVARLDLNYTKSLIMARRSKGTLKDLWPTHPSSGLVIFTRDLESTACQFTLSPYKSLLLLYTNKTHTNNAMQCTATPKCPQFRSLINRFACFFYPGMGGGIAFWCGKWWLMNAAHQRTPP